MLILFYFFFFNLLPPTDIYTILHTLSLHDALPIYPWTRYTPQFGPVPERSEVCDEWMVFWALAQRLSLEFDFLGVPLDMTVPPTEDELLAIIARHSVVPFEELKQQPRGCFDHTPQFSSPADPSLAGRFVTMPVDVCTAMTVLSSLHFFPPSTF